MASVSRKRPLMEANDEITTDATERTATKVGVDRATLTAHVVVNPKRLAEGSSVPVILEDVERKSVVVAATPTSWRPRCENLYDMLNTNRNVAIFRQFAINVELDLKIRLLILLPAATQDQFKYVLNKTAFDNSRIVSTPLRHFIDAVDSAGKFNDFLSSYTNAVDPEDPAFTTRSEFETFLGALRNLKNAFLDEAHPVTTLDNKEVTYDYLAGLVDNSGLVTATDVDIVRKGLKCLNSIRQKSGDDIFLGR